MEEGIVDETNAIYNILLVYTPLSIVVCRALGAISFLCSTRSSAIPFEKLAFVVPAEWKVFLPHQLHGPVQ